MAADTRHYKRALRRLSEATQNAIPGLVFDLVETRARSEGRRPKYVQVGAHDGVLDDPIYAHVAQGTWDAVLLEPGAQAFAALSELHKERPGVQCLQVGASDEAGSTSLFTLAPDARSRYPKWASGGASIDRESLFVLMKLRRPDAREDDIIEEHISLRTLDDILVETKSLDADGLIVDVEGHEPAVFKGTNFGHFLPAFVLFEHLHLTTEANSVISKQLREAHYRGFRLSKDTLCLTDAMCSPGLLSALSAVGAEEWVT